MVPERLFLNGSSDDAKIENPLDYLQIILQDEEGWPVKLPLATPARAMFNAPGPIEITRSFKVESIEKPDKHRQRCDCD